MTERTLQAKVRKIKELEAQQKSLEKQISSLKADIQEEMKDREQLQAGEYLVRWTRVVSNKFDSKTFQSEHSRLFKKYVKEVESRRFTIAESK